MGNRTNRLTESKNVVLGAAMFGLAATANAETLEGKTSHPNASSGATVVALNTTDYEARIAELSAELKSLPPCEKNQGLATLKCIQRPGEIRAEIGVLEQKIINAEQAQRIEKRRENIATLNTNNVVLAKEVARKREELAKARAENEAWEKVNEQIAAALEKQ